MAPAVAFDEKRADAHHQATEKRPRPQLRFGDEARRMNGMDDEDVEPRDVIRDNNEIAAKLLVRSTMAAQLDIDDAQQASRPLANERMPFRSCDPGKHEQRGEHTFHGVQTEASQTV